MGSIHPASNVFVAAASGPAPPPLPMIPIGGGVQEPFSLLAASRGTWVTDADQLFIQWQDPVDILPVMLFTARVLTADGNVTTIQETITASGEIFPSPVFFPLPDGYIISLSVKQINGQAQPGSLYLTAGIFRQTDAIGTFFEALISGYLCPNNVLSWPEGTKQQPGDGAGMHLRLGPTGNNPSPLEIGNIPRICRVRLHSCDVNIVTSAAVGNRNVQLYINTGSVLTSEPSWTGATVLPPSTTTRVTFSSSGQEIAAPGLLNIPIPETVLLLSSWAVGVNIIGADALDRINHMAIDIEVWAGFASAP